MKLIRITIVKFNRYSFLVEITNDHLHNVSFYRLHVSQHLLLLYFYEGFGVEQLRDNNFETYWQSDGHLPHLVNIQFKVRI